MPEQPKKPEKPKESAPNGDTTAIGVDTKPVKSLYDEKNPRPAVFARPDEAAPKEAPKIDDEEDRIPVEQLIKVARELTQRITNDDRQRLAKDLKESGHQINIRTKAPLEIMEFFAGEIDLDTELAKRFANAPLVSQLSLRPPKPAPGSKHRAIAMMTSQDERAMVTMELHPRSKEIGATFTLGGMLSQRFNLGNINMQERQRWLELMRRNSGIAFLWTENRWEEDYMIFIVRENFARVYAFSPRRFEAAARITPDVLDNLLDWLELFWFKDAKEEEKRDATMLTPPAGLPERIGNAQKPSPPEIKEPPSSEKSEDSQDQDKPKENFPFEW